MIIKKHTKVLRVTFLILLLALAEAKGKDKNVLSYYAINNSIDGQPMIDMENVLRFFPVFTYRDNIDSVKVTLYIGPTIFTQNAARCDAGSHWEVLLPKFELGQSIQRYEVETVMRIPKNTTISLLEKIHRTIADLDTSAQTLTDRLASVQKYIGNDSLGLKPLRDAVVKLNKDFKKASVRFDPKDTAWKEFQMFVCKVCIDSSRLRDVGQPSSINIDSLKAAIMTRTDSVTDSLFRAINNIRISNSTKLDEISTTINLLVPGTINLRGLINQIDSDESKARSFIAGIDDFSKSLAEKTKENIHKNLIDTSQSGKGVLIGDILLYNINGVEKARILYRNYNPENRRLPALDPVERLSIYRIRYIPFPIIGNQLAGPFEKDKPIVFEAGISFGNVMLSSNDVVLSPFSFQRFGVSIAFTPKLFASDAQIKALALTYDFNAYASLSGGVNFGTLSPSNFGSYFSLGINFKAFQLLLSNTKKIFNN